MDKSTISMAIFNSFLYVYQRLAMLVYQRAQNHPSHLKIRHILRLKAVGFPNHSKSLDHDLVLKPIETHGDLGIQHGLRNPHFCTQKKLGFFKIQRAFFVFLGS